MHLSRAPLMSMLLNPYFNSKTSCYWTWLFPPSKQFFAWLSQPALFCFYSSVSWLPPPHTPGTCFRTRCWDFFSKATHFVGDLIMSKDFKSHLYETMTSQFFLLSCFFCPWTSDLYIQQSTYIFTGVFNWKIKLCMLEIKVVILFLVLALPLFFSHLTKWQFLSSNCLG